MTSKKLTTEAQSFSPQSLWGDMRHRAKYVGATYQVARLHVAFGGRLTESPLHIDFGKRNAFA